MPGGVPDRNRQDPAEEVQVLVAVGVPDAQALALGKDDRLGVVLDRRGKEELFVFLACGFGDVRGGRLSLGAAHGSSFQRAAARAAPTARWARREHGMGTFVVP